jgi:hypothetical protein
MGLAVMAVAGRVSGRHAKENGMKNPINASWCCHQATQAANLALMEIHNPHQWSRMQRVAHGRQD